MSEVPLYSPDSINWYVTQQRQVVLAHAVRESLVSRGTSLIRRRILVALYSRPVPRAPTAVLDGPPAV